MRVISIALFFTLAFFAVCMPTEKKPVNDAAQRDILDTLMPMFGNIKLHTIVSARTIEFVRRFFDLNPKYYTSFQTELASEGITLPDFANLNWNVLTSEDFNLIKAFIGDATLLKVATDREFVKELEQQLKDDPSLIERLESRVVEAGIVYEDVDVDSLGNTLLETFKPMMIAFTPIAMQILFFGKRDVEKNILDDALAILQPILGQVVNQALAGILGGLLGKRDAEKINLQEVLSFFQSAQFQQLYQQYAPLAQQLFQQYGPMVQQFLNSNPAIMSVITQQLSPIINLLPFLPKADLLESLFQLALPILNNFLGTALSSLLGKRDLEKNIFDDAWNAIQPVINQVIVPALPSIITGLLGGLLGKRDVEKINLQQALSFFQSAQFQQLYQQYAPLAQQLFQQYGPMVQQFLNSNPAIMSVITQQLSPIINLLPFLPKVDLLESLFQLGLPILNNLLGTALSGLFGKRDLEKNILDDALNAIQPILGQVVNQVIGTLLGSLLGKRDLEKNILDDAWTVLQPILGQVVNQALAGILGGLLGKRDLEKNILDDALNAIQPILGQVVNQVIGTLLGSLLGKRDLNKNIFDDAWNTIQPIINQVIVPALPSIITGLLGGLLGKRDVEKINLQQVLSFFQSAQFQQLYQQYAPLAQQLFQQYGPIVQQFLNSNPAIMSVITQQLSPIINLLPFLPKADLLESLFQLALPILNNFLGTALSSLLGKRDLEKNILDDAWTVLQPILGQVVNQALAGILGGLLGKRDLEKNIFDDAWNAIQPVINQVIVPALPSIITGLLGGLLGKRDLNKNILDDLNNIVNQVIVPALPSIISGLLTSLIGKRAIEKNIFDDAWNTIQPIINQVIVPALPSIITSVLTGLLGKRDVEKINLQDILSFVQSSQIQQLYQQYAPLAQQLFQQYVPMIQQFLNANPAILSAITQQLSPIINLLPNMPKADIIDTVLETLQQLVVPAATNILGSLLISLLG